MRFIIKITPFFALLLVMQACDTTRKASSGDDGIIEITFLQMNDVYEISPLSDGTGGMSRVGTIRKELIAQNQNTFTVLAGDFISPSVIGSLKYQNVNIRGKQMIEVMNALGVDWVTFGNHEFDYSKLSDLQARIDESNFLWMGANARLVTEAGAAPVPFFKNRPTGKTDCPDEIVLTVKDADGTIIKLGLFGVLTDTGKKDWVTYTDWMEAAQKSREKLRAQNVDVVVGLTHLLAADDIKLAEALPDVPLIMGGHDHENQIHRVGNSVVAKADANARTVYVHHITYNKKTKKATLTSELRPVNGSIQDDPTTAAAVAKWEKIKTESLTSSGFSPTTIVTTLTTPLDCRETIVRNQQAPVGDLITKSMLAAAKTKPEIAFFNAGSIRVDDVLTGPVYELDIVRMLPFGGGISEVEMTGALLKRTLDVGKSNKGIGGYLQLSTNITENGGNWLIKQKAIDPAKMYRVAIADFLLTGNEQNLGFLAATDAAGKVNPDIKVIYRADSNNKNDIRGDIRKVLIQYWKGK